ncbi:MAG: hypothetical protein JJ879_07070 [Sneathiella sp.]|nr:hypothetical protein [Sneathiella sp.]
MKIGTSHNELEELLSPRCITDWTGGVYTFWDRDLLILNEANDAFDQSIEEIEEGLWEFLEEQWALELRKLPGSHRCAWQKDFELLCRIMSADQMNLYLPALVQFVASMPRRMIAMRRKVVSRFLLRKHNGILKQFPILTKQYVQSAPLLFPAHDLFRRSDRFASVVRWNADQANSSQRERLCRYIKLLVRMNDEELTCRFTDQDSYERELERLLVLSRDFRLTVADVYLESPSQRINVELEKS